MTHYSFKNFFKIVLLAKGLLLTSLAVFIYFSSYEELLTIVKPAVLRDIYETLRPYEKDLFTNSRYTNLQIYSIVIAIVAFFLLWYCWMNLEKIERFVNYFLKTTHQKIRALVLPLKEMSPFQKKLLLFTVLGILVHRIYYTWLLLTTNERFISGQSFYDEGVSYSYFVQQGWIATLTYYPDTNNHILYNLICLFVGLFTDSMELTMRLPALLINILLIAFIFLSLNKLFNFTTAIIALSFSGFLYSASIYAMVGRGYMLLSLLTFIACVSIYNYCLKKENYYLYVFTLASIAGFYTVPIYIYQCASLGFILLTYLFLNKNTQPFYPLIKTFFLIGVGVFIVYLPVILISGPGALLGQNRWIEPMDLRSIFHALPAYVAELSEYVLSITGILRRGYIYAFIIALCIFIYTLRHQEKKSREWLWIVIGSAVIPMVVMVVMRVFAPYRALSYYPHIFFAGGALVVSDILMRTIKNEALQKWTLYSIILAIMIGGFYSYTFVRYP